MLLINTFCPHCDTEVVASITEQTATLNVLGDDTTFTELVATCPLCKNPIGDSEVESINLKRAYQEREIARTTRDYDRALTLLKATRDLLDKQNHSNYVLNMFVETVFYDGTDCDGSCLLEDINDFLDED